MECGYSEPKKKERNQFIRGAAAAATFCCNGLFRNRMSLLHYAFKKKKNRVCVCVCTSYETYTLHINSYIFIPSCFIISK